MKTIIKYGLKCKKTGLLATYDIYANDPESEYCNDTRCELGFYINGPTEWLLDSIDDVKDALREDTPWYNSDTKKPMLGNVNPSECEIVRVTSIVNIEIV